MFNIYIYIYIYISFWLHRSRKIMALSQGDHLVELQRRVWLYRRYVYIYIHTYTHTHTYICINKSKSTFLPSPFLVNRVAPFSVSLAFGPHSCASTVNATVGGWPYRTPTYSVPRENTSTGPRTRYIKIYIYILNICVWPCLR